MTFLMWIICAVNVMVFIMYAYDKIMAVSDRWRVPERVMLLSALCMGATGAYLAMRIFRHKTLKPLFAISVPVMMLLQLALLGWKVFF